MACKVILGACSGMASQMARIWAAEHHHLLLVARKEPQLNEVAQDLLVRGAQVTTLVLDLNDADASDKILSAMKELATRFGNIDTVLYAAGTYSAMNIDLTRVDLAMVDIESNFTAMVRIMMPLGDFFQRQRFGTLTVISSVAGDRGRKTTLIYGASKAGVNAFVDGLRGYLAPYGVKVLLVKPGPCDTPMLQKFSVKAPLMATPERIARDIYQAITQRKRQVYSPWYWRPIMFVLRHIPNVIFDRLKI